MTEPHSTTQEAGDPSTSPERLLELTEKHPQLHRLLVRNPSTPEVARQWILATNPWAKQAYEASLAPRPTGDDGSAPAPEPAAADPTDAGAGTAEAGSGAAAGSAAAGSGVAGGFSKGAEESEPEVVDAWADLWGDLGTASAEVAPTPAPTQDAPTTVRIAEHSPVVALGPASSPVQHAPAPTASTPAPAPQASPSPPAAQDWDYDAPPAPGAYATPVAAAGMATSADGPVLAAGQAVPGAHSAATAPGTGEDQPRRTLRAVLACGGCLVLALILLIAIALAGRAWFGGDDSAQDPTSAPATQTETPEEESAPPSETPSESPSEEPDPVSPAPEGAHEMTALRSPTGNISCRLSEDSVACSLVERDFSEAGLEDCDNGPFSLRVEDAEPALACGKSFLAENGETLEYDESATYGDVACTSRFDGMTCWNVMTGKGFMVNRSTYETF